VLFGPDEGVDVGDEAGAAAPVEGAVVALLASLDFAASLLSAGLLSVEASDEPSEPPLGA